MQLLFTAAYSLQERAIALPIISQEGFPVFEHGLGRLLRVVERVVLLAEMILYDADFLSQLYKGLAILRIGHSKIAGDALCFTDCLSVGCIYGRQPFRQQGHLCVRRKVGLQLLANGTQSVLFTGRADERYQIVITPKLRDQLDILAQRLRSVLSQPIDDNAEHPALTKASANIASEEQDLHSNIRVLRICADKASDDFLIVGCTERADHCKQIQTVRHCACVGNCAVFCVGNIRLTLQMIQHFNSSNQTAQKNFITQTP